MAQVEGVASLAISTFGRKGEVVIGWVRVAGVRWGSVSQNNLLAWWSGYGYRR